MMAPALANSAAMARLSSGSIVPMSMKMPPRRSPVDDAVRAERHGAHRLGVGDDGETISASAAAARGVGAQRMPASISGAALSASGSSRSCVSGRQQARHDELPHGAQSEKAQIHDGRPLSQ